MLPIAFLWLGPLIQGIRERTHHSENEDVYHSDFAWYVERSPSVDINPKSYHLAPFELINQLPCINFPSFECRFFLKDLKSALSSSVAS